MPDAPGLWAADMVGPRVVSLSPAPPQAVRLLRKASGTAWLRLSHMGHLLALWLGAVRPPTRPKAARERRSHVASNRRRRRPEAMYSVLCSGLTSSAFASLATNNRGSHQTVPRHTQPFLSHHGASLPTGECSESCDGRWPCRAFQQEGKE